MIKRNLNFAFLTLVLIVIDQCVKFATHSYISLNQTISVLGNMFSLTHVPHMAPMNQSIFVRAYFPILLIAGLGILFLFFRQRKASIYEWLGLSLLLAGACSNGFDIFNRGFVIDTFNACSNVYHCKAFDCADVYLFLGFLISAHIVVREFFKAHERNLESPDKSQTHS